MSQVVHRRRVGDTRTVLPVTLKQPDSTGALAVVDLTGLGTPTFRMVNAADGTDAIADTATGVDVVSAAAGTVNYQFSSGGVDTAGVFWGTFTVTDTAKTDAFPVSMRGLKIVIDSAVSTGEESFLAAVGASP